MPIHFGLVMAGMLDHRLLIRTLQPVTPHLAPEPEDPLKPQNFSPERLLRYN